MTVQLHQITMGHAVEEDRLLLRISTTDKKEYQLWLTRRFVRVLWSALIKVLEKQPGAKAALKPSAKKAVMAMQHDEAVNTSDFSRPHDEGNQNMTSATGPLLVTGGTVIAAANALKEHGAEDIYCCVTHPVFSGDAARILMDSVVQEFVVTDTLELPAEKRDSKVKVISVASLLGEGIHRIHSGLSVGAMFDVE